MPKLKRKEIKEEIQKYCNPKSFPGNKKNKRDYNNLFNQSQQMLKLLGKTVHFEFDERKRKLSLRKELKRSEVEKQRYFKEHSISLKDGFDIHHIVPLSQAREEENEDSWFNQLDDWRNMIYINAYQHRLVRKLFKLVPSENDNELIFSDLKEKEKKALKNRETVYYNSKKKKILLDYNRDLRDFR